MHFRKRIALLCSSFAVAACADVPTLSTHGEVAPRANVVEAPPEGSYLSRNFVRASGAPELMELVVNVPATTRELTLRLNNGARSGAARVSSATISVNGARVLEPSDFSQQFAGRTVVVPIGASRPVTLGVRLQGAPGSFVHIDLLAGVPLDAQGGTLSLDGGAVTVEAPAGAVVGNVQLTAEPIPADAAAGELVVYDFGPDGSQFSKPLTVTLPYDATAFPPGADPQLYWRRDADSPWRTLQNTRFDAGAGTATGEIDHFTQIGVLVGRIRVCPGNSQAVPTIDAAYPLLAPGGRIVLCDAVHVPPATLLQKALTIESNGSFKSRIEGAVPYQFELRANPGDTLRLRNLLLRHQGAYAVRAVAAGGTIEMDGLVIENLTSGASGVYAALTDAAGSYIVVRNSTVTGGQTGLFAPNNGAVTTGRVDFIGNTVSSSGFVSIQYQGRGARGTARGNTISACGSVGCLTAQSTADVEFSNNVIRLERRPQLPTGIANAMTVNATSAVISGNIIEGIGDIAERGLPASYPLRDGALLIAATTAPTYAVVSGNTFSGGARGIQAVGQNSANVPTVVGTDNVVFRVRDALAVRGGARVTMRRSDFSDYLGAVFYDYLNVPAPLQATDLACNWWGTASGPTGSGGYLAFPRIVPATTVYQPVAVEPIANRPTVSCSY